MSYFLVENATSEKSERAPSLASLFWEPPEFKEPEFQPDLDKDGYKRIISLENEVVELRKIMVNIYKTMNEGAQVNEKVQAVKEKSTINEMKQKQVQDLVSKARILK